MKRKPVWVIFFLAGSAILAVVNTVSRADPAAAGVAPAADGRAGWLCPALRVRGGFAVLIGRADDPAPADMLRQSGPWIVHRLEARPEVVGPARRKLLAEGTYGPVTIEHWGSPGLPYADNLVNLLVVLDTDSLRAGREEVARVLAPNGAAYVLSGDGQVEHWRKPRPDGMGEWTHPLGGADGNQTSADRILDVPNDFQWVAGPIFNLRSRMFTPGVILSAGGRFFTLTTDVPENLEVAAHWPEGRHPTHADALPLYLVARDAFNGVVLWSRQWEGVPGILGELPMGADFLHPPEALVAADERLYAIHHGAVAVIDAVDGQIIETWPFETTGEEMQAQRRFDQSGKLLLDQGVLVVQAPPGLYGFDAESGTRRWHHAVENPWGALMHAGRVFFFHSTRQRDGHWEHRLTALDASGGHEIWTQILESRYSHPNLGSPLIRLYFAGGDVLTLVERNVFRGLSVADGRELWQREPRAESRTSHYDSRQVGHFFVEGRIWMRDQRARGGRSAPETWQVLNPATGAAERQVTVTGNQGVVGINVTKVGCQLVNATARFLLEGRLSTMWDWETGQRGGFKFARGGCTIGIIPANGLAYVPPNSCGCLNEQLRGFLALVHTQDPGLHSIADAPLETGPAFGRVDAVDEPQASGWRTYRGDGERSAYLPRPIAPQLTPVWQTRVSAHPDWTPHDREWQLRVGRRLTPPVSGNGLVLLAEPQTHQIVALDAATGAERWRFTAGGRVSMPPTLHRGLALFGAHDGYVYAVRVADGELAWRRRAAPSDRRILAYGQLESAWPIHGGVLVHRDLALVVAGRAVDAGGGLVVRALDPWTGQFLWSRRVDDARYGMGEILVTDGEHVYLMDKRLDLETGAVTDLDFQYRVSARGGAENLHPDGVRYLRGGKAGLHEISWTAPQGGWDNALRKVHSTWTWGREVEGEILAFGGDMAFAFQIDMHGRNLWSHPKTRGGGTVMAWRTADGEVVAPDPPLAGDFRVVHEDREERGHRDPRAVRGIVFPDLLDGEIRVAAEMRLGDNLRDGDRILEGTASADLGETFRWWKVFDIQWQDGGIRAGREQIEMPSGSAWVEVEVVIDTLSRRYDLFLDGERRAEGVPYYPRTHQRNSFRSLAYDVPSRHLRVSCRPLPEVFAWTHRLESPAQVEAMLATEDALFIAGPDDRFAPRGTGFLHVLAREGGQRLASRSLPVVPVHDGLAATADGRVLIVLRDGNVLCLKPEE